MGDNDSILREIADLFGQLQECFSILVIEAEAKEEAEETQEVEEANDIDDWTEDDDL